MGRDHCKKEERRIRHGEGKLAPIDSWHYLADRTGRANASSLSTTFADACYPSYFGVLQALKRLTTQIGIEHIFTTCTERSGKYSPGGSFEKMLAPLKVSSLPYHSGAFANGTDVPWPGRPAELE